MKNIIIIALLFAFSNINAQNFNYQMVVRDASNSLILNQNVGVQIKIRTGSATGTDIYTETHVTTTNDYGLAVLLIGTGTTVDNFSTIDWSTQNHWINSSVDITGGTTYVDMGTTEMRQVPYAAYANFNGTIGAFNTTSNTTSNSNEDYAVNDFVFGSDRLENDQSTLDDSNRFYFDKERGAFRAGSSAGNGWNSEFPYSLVGNGSIGLGINSVAVETNSIAIGPYQAFNFATNGVVLGFGSTVEYNADNAVSIGYSSKAYGQNSVAMGANVTANSYGNMVLGSHNVSHAGNNTAYVAIDQLFVLGGGRQASEASNAIEVLKNGNTLFSGNVGIGTTVPETNYAVNVNGNLNYSGTLTNISDRRYKKAIQLIPNSSEKLLQTKGVQYQMKSDEFPEMKFPEGQQFGVIAQDVEKVFPNLVKTNNRGFKSVNYIGLLPVLIETLKQQQQTLSKFEEKVNKVKELEKKYYALLELKSKNKHNNSVVSKE